MKFPEFYLSLKADEKVRYLENIGVSQSHMDCHLVPAKTKRARKIPRKKTIVAMAAFSSGECTCREVLDYFYEISSDEAA